MANVRADVSLKGIKVTRATYIIDDSTITYEATVANGTSHVGKAVTLSDDNTIALAGDGVAIEGGLVSVSADGFAEVEISGGVELPAGDGATLTNGKKIVGDLGAASAKGYIREVNTATAAELGVARGRIIDNSTTTAVLVMLD